MWRGTTPTPLSYYDLALWGYRGQPLEFLLGVILVPLLILEPVRVLVVMGTRPVRSPFKRHAHRPLEESAHLLHEAPDPTPGLRLYSHQRKQPLRNAKSPRVFEVMDGKALPNILDRCSMSFFQPPPLNTLEPYQLEFLENIFEQVWSQIVPRHYPLSPDLRQHLQTEISARLCSFVARGVMEPTVLLGLTVATVKSPRRKVRRRGRLATPHPVRG